MKVRKKSKQRREVRNENVESSSLAETRRRRSSTDDSSKTGNAQNREIRLSLLEYLKSQLGSFSSNDEVTRSRESTRIRVYNTLFRVPYHLERLIWIGVLSCLDSLLMFLTMSPLRLFWSYLTLHRQSDGRQLFDFVCCVVVVLGTYLHMQYLEPGMLYFGMKDVTAEFLKITLLYVALDIAEKILSNLGVDIIGIFSESCDLYYEARTSIWSLSFDCVLFFVVCTVHSVIVLSIAMVWYVALESEKAILSFMLISNFGEIKTTVFKRFDWSKTISLCRLDIVERTNLVIAALFIAVEDLGQNGKWTLNSDLIFNCFLIVFLESLVDMIKHSVVVNFNRTPPEIYREYLKEFTQGLIQNRGLGTFKKLVFEPLGPAIVVLRILVAAMSIGNKHKSLLDAAKTYGVAFCVLLLARLCLGWSLQLMAVWYQNHHAKHYSNSNGRTISSASD